MPLELSSRMNQKLNIERTSAKHCQPRENCFKNSLKYLSKSISDVVLLEIIRSL